MLYIYIYIYRYRYIYIYIYIYIYGREGGCASCRALSSCPATPAHFLSHEHPSGCEQFHALADYQCERCKVWEHVGQDYVLLVGCGLQDLRRWTPLASAVGGVLEVIVCSFGSDGSTGASSAQCQHAGAQLARKQPFGNYSSLLPYCPPDMYIYIYIYIYIYNIYIHICICIYVCSCHRAGAKTSDTLVSLPSPGLRIYIYIYLSIYLPIYIYIYKYVYVHKYIPIYSYRYVYVCILIYSPVCSCHRVGAEPSDALASLPSPG